MRGNKGRFLSRQAAERAVWMKTLRLEQVTPETLHCLRGWRIVEFEVLINNLKGHCLIFLSAIYQLFIEYFNIK